MNKKFPILYSRISLNLHPLSINIYSVPPYLAIKIPLFLLRVYSIILTLNLYVLSSVTSSSCSKDHLNNCTVIIHTSKKITISAIKSAIVISPPLHKDYKDVQREKYVCACIAQTYFSETGYLL